MRNTGQANIRGRDGSKQKEKREIARVMGVGFSAGLFLLPPSTKVPIQKCITLVRIVQTGLFDIYRFFLLPSKQVISEQAAISNKRNSLVVKCLTQR